MPSSEILRTPRLLLRYQTPADILPLIALWRVFRVPNDSGSAPVAVEEAHVLMLEPKSTRNTGNVENERTVEAEWI